MTVKLLIDDQVVFEKDLLDLLDGHKKPDFVGQFSKYIGVKEYDGIVATIQKWFYGSLVKASWCATSVSYFADQLGVLNDIGGKNENVYLMMEACRKAGKGQFFDKANLPKTIEKNDILFYLYSGDKMTTTSNKHVCICAENTSGDFIKSIGGNQSDSICIKSYARKDLYAVYRL